MESEFITCDVIIKSEETHVQNFQCEEEPLEAGLPSEENILSDSQFPSQHEAYSTSPLINQEPQTDALAEGFICAAAYEKDSVTGRAIVKASVHTKSEDGQRTTEGESHVGDPQAKNSKESNAEKCYTCENCGKTFKYPSSLKRHQTIHTGLKSYTCSECGKSFTQSGHLNAHQRIHLGTQPYTCDECGKSFNQYGNLEVHQRSHSGIRPFTCEECGKSFIHTSSLKLHQRSHSDVRPYICEECGKSFNRAGNLKVHQQVHSRTRPYVCDLCGKSFIQFVNLKVHQRVHS